MAGVAGFDSLAYPGDTAMQWLLANTNLKWCGYYLAPAPSRQTSPWLGKYATLSGFGWNMVPIYVGQQAQGPGSHIVTAAQGTIDGNNAAALAKSEAILTGTVIFLDIEQGPPVAQPALDYYKAWVDAVYASDYYPGVYCSYKLGAPISAADPRAVVWCFNINTYPNNTAVNAPYPEPDPTGCTFVGAALWQLSQNVTIKIGGAGQTHNVDLDVASTADPAGNAPAKTGSSSSDSTIKEILNQVGTASPPAAAEIPVVEDVLDNLVQAESTKAAIHDTFFDWSGNAVLVETTFVSPSINLALPGFEDASVKLGEGDELEIELALTFGDTGVRLMLSDLPLSITFKSQLLRQMVQTPDGWAVADPADVVFLLQGSTIEIDGAGTLRISDLPPIVPGPIQIGNTGIVLDVKSIQILSGAEQTPPAGIAPGSKGVYIADADVHLPQMLRGLSPSDLHAEGLFIGTGGMNGKITSSWGTSGTKPISIGGITCSLESVSLEFKQNSLVDSELKCTLTVPFFDQPLNLDVSLSGDGAFLASLSATQPANVTYDNGLVHFEKKNVFKATLEALAFAESHGVAKLSMSGELTPTVGAPGLHWPTLEIRELSIDSNGHVHFDGGWTALSTSYSMEFYGAKLEITKFGMGMTDDGGKYVGLSGKVELVKGLPAGASVEGLRVTWYDDSRLPAISFNGIGISFKTPAIEFDGHVSYTQQGNAHQFKGDLKLSIPAANHLTLIGKAVFGADAKGNKYFAIYVEGDFGTGIPLWATGLSLFGVAGLLAINYAPDKPPTMPWYSIDKSNSWFHKPEVGVIDIVNKWTPAPGTFALGAGVTLGTATDNGHAFNGKFLLLLLCPGPVLMIDGTARFLVNRDDPAEPPFHGLIVLDNRAGYFLVGLDARWKSDKAQGALADVSGSMEAFFNYHDPTQWHLWLGKRDPVAQRIQARIAKTFTANAYFMLDAKQLALGAWIGKSDHYKFGPVQADMDAYLESNAYVNFKPPQFHVDLHLHGYLAVKVFKFKLGIGLDAILNADVFKPFHILGELHITIETWIKNFDIQLRLEWGPHADPPAMHSPELLPVLNWGIAHPKSSAEWPLSGPGALPASPAPVVPVDCRPYVTFGYPIHDAIGVGVNTGPDPGWTIIGDPARGEGSARVRYSLKSIEMYRDGQLFAACPQPPKNVSPNVGKIFGSWAPVVPGTSGGQNKLLLGSKNPLDFADKTASWNPWLSSNLPGYPCPDTSLETVCVDFEKFAIGQQLNGAWWDPQKLDFRFDWSDAGPHPIRPVSAALPGYDRGLFFAAPPRRRTYRAYVSNQFDNSVSVVDVTTRKVLVTIPVGQQPRHVVLSPDGKRAYVCSQDDAAFIAIDTATNQRVGAPVKVIKGPVSISITQDGKRAFVPSGLEATMAVIDLKSLQVSTVALAAVANQAVLSPDGKKLYVIHGPASAISVFSVNPVAFIKTVAALPGTPAMGAPAAMVIHPTAPRAWVSFASTGKVRAFDTSGDVLLPLETPTGTYPRDLALSPDGSRLYVGNLRGNTVSVLDTATLGVLATIATATPAGLRMTSDGASLLVGNYNGGTISIIDPSQNAVVGQGIAAGNGSDAIAVLENSPLPVVPLTVTIDVPPGSSSVEVTWAGSGTLSATVTKPVAPTPAGVGGAGSIGVSQAFMFRPAGADVMRSVPAGSTLELSTMVTQPGASLPPIVTTGGGTLVLDASKLGANAAASVQGIDQIRLSSDADWTLVRVCVTKLRFAGGLAEQQRVHAALDQTVDIWKTPTAVLEPERKYEVRVDWSAEVQGTGDLNGWADSFSSTTLSKQTKIAFQTSLPPSLETVPDPNVPPKNPPPTTGLDDLTLYVRGTVPVTQTPAHQLPELPKPVFCGYDVTVEFNETYVDQMYQMAARDLDLLLFDRNNQLVRDAAGPLIVVEDAWSNAPKLVLTDTQARWIEMFNANSCKLQVIKPATIPTSKVLRADDAHVLAADTVYQARLVPQLLHQLDIAGPAWTAASGSAWTDYRVSVLATLKTSDTITILFRSTTAGHYEFTIEPKNNRRRLTRVSGGSPTKLAEDYFAYHPGKDDPYRIHIEALGSALLVAQNGSVVFAVTDTTLPTGTVGLSQPAGQTVFRDLGVSDLSTGAPVAYRFNFTTSKVANFYHLIHTFQDVVWPRDAAAPPDLSAATAPSPDLANATAAQPISDVEIRGYDRLASLVLGSASAQDPPQLDVTQVARGSTVLGWLLRSPEPIDFTRTHVKLSTADRLFGRALGPGAVKITEAKLGDAESVTVLAREEVDLSGYCVQYRQNPSAVADELGSRSLWQGGTAVVDDPTMSDYRASVVCSATQAGGIGLQFRYRDAQNYYAFTYDVVTGVQQIVKTVNGTPKVLTSAPGDPAPGFPNAPLVRLAVSVHGSQITGYRAGKNVVQASDSEFPVGGAGVFTGGNPSAHFERFEIRRLPNEAYALHQGRFSTNSVTGWPSSADGSGLQLNAVGKASWTDLIVRARVRRASGGTTGLLLRYRDPSNHYRLVFTDAERRLERVVNGKRATLWSAPGSPAVGRVAEIAVSIAGATFSVFQDSVLACEVVDALLASGSVGLCAAPGADLEVSQLDVYPPELAYANWTLRDDFTGIAASRWSFVDAGDHGGPSAWHVAKGRLTQTSTIGDSSDPLRGRGTVAVLTDSTSADVRLVTRLASNQPGAIGAVFGYQDADNFYRFSMDGAAGYRRLVSCVKGKTTPLWSDGVKVDLVQEHVLTLDVIDDCVTVWLDGQRVCQWRKTAEIGGALGLYCSGNPGASFAGVRVGSPAWIDYYTFGPEQRLSAGNRVQITPAKGVAPPNRRTSMRIAAELDDPGFDRLPPDGTRLRVVAPDHTVGHARDFIPTADFNALPFQALRKADGTGIFLAPTRPGQTVRLSFDYQRDDGVIAFTEIGESGDELVFIDLPSV